MIPARIQVFDGLRVTTEHILHFQESLQSAIEEVRAVLGLGRVHVGFEVVARGADGVSVGPGIAFDAAGGRIVHEEVEQVTLDTTVLATGDAILYTRREVIERGQIEGHATLLWDDCSFHLRATPPDPGEGLVPLARVRSDDAGLVVEPLIPAQAGLETAPAAPVVAAAPERAPALGDVLRLSGETNGDGGRAQLLGAVRATLAPDSPTATAPAESAVVLATAPLAALPTALSAQLLLCATRRDATPSAPGGAPPPPLWRRECEAHGNARKEGADWRQNGLCRTVTFLPGAAMHLARAALVEGTLVRLVLPSALPQDGAPWAEEDGNPEPLALRVRIPPDAPPRMVVEVVWSGRAHEGLLAQADTLLESLTWSLDAAWQGY